MGNEAVPERVAACPMGSDESLTVTLAVNPEKFDRDTAPAIPCTVPSPILTLEASLTPIGASIELILIVFWKNMFILLTDDDGPVTVFASIAVQPAARAASPRMMGLS